MNIQRLMQSSTEDHQSSVQIVVSCADLKEFGQYLLSEAQNTPKDEESYLSVDETSAILKVNRSTLYRWHKSGYLKPSKVGSKSVYKMSDVKIILNNNN